MVMVMTRVKHQNNIWLGVPQLPDLGHPQSRQQGQRRQCQALGESAWASCQQNEKKHVHFADTSTSSCQHNEKKCVHFAYTSISSCQCNEKKHVHFADTSIYTNNTTLTSHIYMSKFIYRVNFQCFKNYVQYVKCSQMQTSSAIKTTHDVTNQQTSNEN